MKSLSIIASVVLGSALFASAGQPMASKMVTEPAPADEGFFFTAAAGPVWFQDLTFEETFQIQGDTIRAEADIEFETGWGGTLGFGYKFASGIALGASAGYYTADTDSVDISIQGGGVDFDVTGELDGELVTVPLNINVAYCFALTEAIHSYVGVGAGATYVDFDTELASTSDWEFGAQAFAGFGYKLTDSVALTLGYRLLYTQVDDESLWGHALEAGVGVRF